jgi:hypothetical protein
VRSYRPRLLRIGGNRGWQLCVYLETGSSAREK